MLRRCTPCLLFLASLACAAFSVHAQAASPVEAVGPLAKITPDGLLSLVGALLLAVLAGYARGQERRLTAVEIEQRQIQSQILLFRETVLERHPTRPELIALAESMRDSFAEVKAMIRDIRQ